MYNGFFAITLVVYRVCDFILPQTIVTGNSNRAFSSSVTGMKVGGRSLF